MHTKIYSGLKKLIFGAFTLLVIMWVLFISFNYETTELDAEERDKLGADFIKLKHGYVHFEDIGDKNSPPVLLIHGFSVPAYLWDKNINALIESGFRVIRLDLYGRGYSARPEIDYTLDLFVEQVEELSNALQLNQPFHLVGISMGGAIATRYATRYPHKLRSLSLLAPLVETPERTDLKLIAIPGVGEFLATVVMMPKVKNNLGNTVYDVNSYPEWSELMDTHIHFKGYRRALLSTVRYLSGKSFVEDYEALGKTGIPTQLIWGKDDPVVPITQAKMLLKNIPNLHFHPLEKTGHLPQIEQSVIVNDLLIHHFDRNTNNLK